MDQSINELKQAIQLVLPAKRFAHTLGVYETAIKLAKIFGETEEKVAIAALLHDIAKYLPDEDMKRLLKENNELNYLNHSSLVWHAPVGAYIAASSYQITDSDILNAITYHTTGRASMSVLEKIIYLADYIEPNRTQPGVQTIRQYCESSLDKAMAHTLNNTIHYLKSLKNADIHPNTIQAFEYYKQYL